MPGADTARDRATRKRAPAGLRPRVLLGVLLTGALAACSSSPGTPTTPSTSVSAPPSVAPTTAPSTTAAPPTTTAPAPSTAPPASPSPSGGATLTDAQLAGERVVYSYPGLTPPAALLQRIRAGEVAGVIFFAENVSSSAQLRSVISTLRRAQAASPVHEPLLLMTDQEGGQVRRVPGGPVLSAKQIGATGDPSVAATAGRSAAAALSGLGMNLNLAPVLDVYRSPGDFADQSQRSFSSNPSVVATMGRTFTSAQQEGGVAATAKHFPGLGSAGRNQNTDLGPVTLNDSLSTLRSVDEAPYPPVIAAGVRLIMLSWAVYPALDPRHPAGMSSTIVQQELRDRLGFNGVTVTDALEAKALEGFGTTAQRAVAAAGAGMDLLLCSARDVRQGDSAAQALAAALKSGRLNPTVFRAAADRVTALRAGLH